jgi:hypothetical protein
MRNFLHDQAGVFDPDAVRTLIAAFDSAWQSIKASGANLSDKQIELVRATLAKYIIEQARHGELDPVPSARRRPASLGSVKSEIFATRPEIIISNLVCSTSRLSEARCAQPARALRPAVP